MSYVVAPPEITPLTPEDHAELERLMRNYEAAEHARVEALVAGEYAKGIGHIEAARKALSLWWSEHGFRWLGKSL